MRVDVRAATPLPESAFLPEADAPIFPEDLREPDRTPAIRQLEDAAQAPHPWRRPIAFVFWCVQSLFGIAALIVALAIVAAVPILNFVALGYLLEAEGRVARSGRLRDAFPLFSLAPRLGAISLGFWLWLLPLRVIAGAAADAHLIAPGSTADRAWSFVVQMLSSFVAAHLCLALARGGALSCFFRPIRNVRWFAEQWRGGDYPARAQQAIEDFFRGLRLRHHFWLGVRGYLGGMLWLFLPTLLFASTTRTDGPRILLAILGGFLLVFVLSWAPFLQCRFAREQKFSVWRELRAVRELNRRAPLCFLLATVVTYALAIPLYLAMIAVPPRDALWMVTLIFIVSIYPARILVGWAYAQAARRERRAFFGLRWLCTGVVMPALAFFVFVSFFAPAVGQHGRLVLFEHPALLLPRPF